MVKNVHQWAFQDGLAEHFGGPPGMFERFTDVVLHGEFDKLEDPMTWVLVAQFIADPKGAATECGYPGGAVGLGEHIAVAADGIPWIVASDNTVSRYDPNAGGFR